MCRAGCRKCRHRPQLGWLGLTAWRMMGFKPAEPATLGPNPPKHKTPESLSMSGLRLLGNASVLSLLLVAGSSVLAAEPTDAINPQLARQVTQALAALDADSFADRAKAADQLEKWVADPQLGNYLAREFSAALLTPETSVEVRSRLELLLQRLPSAPQPADERKLSPGEIGPLLDRLNDDVSATRDNAGRRLASMLDHVELIGPVMVEVKRRLADVRLNGSIRRALEPLLEKARMKWVAADPASVPLPPVSDEAIARCIEQLTPRESAESAESSERIAQATARRELVDLVVRDDTRPRVLAQLAEKFPPMENQPFDERVREINDLARPAMAAEVWSHQPDNWEIRQHITVQHLIVGVPQYPENAKGATHFDRIDDRTAHCVSGNSLKEGNYPVGEAIPHPTAGVEIMFCLINLPTPRQRLAYEFHLKRDEGQRLEELSKRTLDGFLARKHVLTELQILMLAQLDPSAVSRFIGPYFQGVPDERLFTTSSELAGHQTVHGGLCFMLSRLGTRDAVPALEQTARSGRLGKPTYESPFQMAWIAALAIARRDPWPDVDAWLARLIDSSEVLVTNVDAKPELGATAAAILLERHDLSPRSFGLEPAGESTVIHLQLTGYRYGNDTSRQDIEQWWAKQAESAAKKSAP